MSETEHYVFRSPSTVVNQKIKCRWSAGGRHFCLISYMRAIKSPRNSEGPRNSCRRLPADSFFIRKTTEIPLFLQKIAGASSVDQNSAGRAGTTAANSGTRRNPLCFFCGRSGVRRQYPRERLPYLGPGVELWTAGRLGNTVDGFELNEYM